MLQNVGGRHGRKLTGSDIQDVPVIALLDLMETRLVREGYLLGADVGTSRLIAVGQQQPDELPLPAADIQHGASSGRGESRADVPAVDQRRSSSTVNPRMLGCVGLVQAIAQGSGAPH